ncbi:class I SAM-dependent methyltransferase [Portibacter marinus]|uniref:class I SAM-dependent methyltransferase n=1 Tax=Portibacter marinus TaxID=2898660 RepID=UPI001F395CFB|nr:methyltransferase domain-containing protein [Portibacter marinus]
MLKSVDYSWLDFEKLITEVAKDDKISSVLEIGAGANPFFSDQQVEALKLEYTILDIDPLELQKATTAKSTRVVHDLSIEPLSQKFDLIFSQMLLEHLNDPMSFHQNILSMMKPESIVCHFFATKYGLPSLLNLLLPSRLSNFIVYKLQKRDPIDHGKFKAYYKKCTGPLKSTISWFDSIGYKVLSFDGYLGHSYLGSIKWLHEIEKLYCLIIRKINNPYFSSNAILVMKSKQK